MIYDSSSIKLENNKKVRSQNISLIFVVVAVNYTICVKRDTDDTRNVKNYNKVSMYVPALRFTNSMFSESQKSVCPCPSAFSTCSPDVTTIPTFRKIIFLCFLTVLLLICTSLSNIDSLPVLFILMKSIFGPVSAYLPCI